MKNVLLASIIFELSFCSMLLTIVDQLLFLIHFYHLSSHHVILIDLLYVFKNQITGLFQTDTLFTICCNFPEKSSAERKIFRYILRILLHICGYIHTSPPVEKQLQLAYITGAHKTIQIMYNFPRSSYS